MTDHDQPQLGPTLQTLLDALRYRIRRYVWWEGVATAAVWLGLAFWISLGVDWLFEPHRGARIVILAGIGTVLAWIVVTRILRRVFVPLSDRSMALLLERYFPQFRDRLITAVELTRRGANGEECDQAMLARTCREAAEPVPGVKLDRVFNPVPRGRAVAAAALLAGSILAFAVAQSGAVTVWARRTLLLDRELLWPRATELVMGEPFAEQAVVKIARGSDLEVTVKANLAKPLVPQVVEIRSRTDGGARVREMMNREGKADPERESHQLYSHTFRSVLTPLSFDVFGGDDSIRNRRIEVVDNPTIVEMHLECEFPPYMGRNPYSVPVTGVMQFPVGTRLTLQARSNKDLTRIAVDSAMEEPPQPPHIVTPADSTDLRSFRFTVDRLAKDKTLLFTLWDTDGIKSRDPVRLTLAAQEDQRPEFSVQLRGIGSAITPQANVPAAGRITDDFGIGRIWFEYGIDPAKLAEKAIPTPSGNPTEVPLDAALDVRELDLKPGQKFHLAIKAADRCDLGPRPNIGSSDRWLLEVVTPEQLRTMLQARELVLRQRFETIIQEMVDARDSLAHVDFGDSPAAKAVPAQGAEPGEKPDQADRSPERLLAQRMLRVQWAVQNSHKDAQETLGIAQAFEDIRTELVNNRLDTTELRLRLEGRIAIPLRRIGNELFAELDRRLDLLQAKLSDPVAGTQSRNQAIAQVDAIVLAMQQVLANILDLEDFNEVVEMLRGILQAQQKLNDSTKQRHKQSLRKDLLE